MKKVDYLVSVGRNAFEWDIIPKEKVEFLEGLEGFSENVYPIYGVKNQIQFGRESKTVNKAWVEKSMGVAYNAFYSDLSDGVTPEVTPLPTPKDIPAPIPAPVQSIPKPAPLPPLSKMEVEEISQEDLEAAAEKYDQIVLQHSSFLCEKCDKTGELCINQCKLCKQAEENGNSIEEQKAVSQAKINQKPVSDLPKESEISFYLDNLFPSFGYLLNGKVYEQKDFPDRFPKIQQFDISLTKYDDMINIFKPIETEMKEIGYNAKTYIPISEDIQEKEIEETIAVNDPKIRLFTDIGFEYSGEGKRCLKLEVENSDISFEYYVDFIQSTSIEKLQKIILEVLELKNELKSKNEQELFSDDLLDKSKLKIFLEAGFEYVGDQKRLWLQIPGTEIKFYEDYLLRKTIPELQKIVLQSLDHLEKILESEQEPESLESLFEDKEKIEEIIEATGVPKDNIIIASIPKTEEIDDKAEKEFQAKREERKVKTEPKITVPVKEENKLIIPVASDSLVKQMKLADDFIEALNDFKRNAFIVHFVKDVMADTELTEVQKLDKISKNISQ